MALRGPREWCDDALAQLVNLTIDRLWSGWASRPYVGDPAATTGAHAVAFNDGDQQSIATHDTDARIAYAIW